MLIKRKELHFKVNSVVESTLIHCREKNRGDEEVKGSPFLKSRWSTLGHHSFS